MLLCMCSIACYCFLGICFTNTSWFPLLGMSAVISMCFSVVSPMQLGTKAQLPKQKAAKVIAGKGGSSRGGQRR